MTNREIDALIQKHLFPWDEAICRGCGWRRIDVDGTPPEGAVGCDAFSCSQRPLRMPPADSPAAFSTDPAASKQLRDRMRELRWHWNISAPIMGGGYIAQFVKVNDHRRTSFSVNPLTQEMIDMSPDPAVFIGKAEADTEELAVALAALKALGVEVQA